MDLRRRKSVASARRSSGGNGFFYVGFGFCVLSLAVTFFAVLASTTYFNAMSDGITKDIAKDDREIYEIQREIRNLKFRIEGRSQKKFISSRIALYNLGLRPPLPAQVVYLEDGVPRMGERDGKRVAYINSARRGY